MAAPLASQDKFQLLIRLGFVARGLLYVTIGFLVLGAGRSEDQHGALRYLGEGAGEWLLILLAAGFAAYGTWRLADAAFGMESGRRGKEALGKRAAAGFSGIVHLFLGYQAFHLWRGATIAEAGSATAQARGVLELPGGVAMLVLVALALIAGGLFQLYDSGRCGFLSRLSEGAGGKSWVKWLGRLGYAARGLIFLACGFFLLRAALEEQPSEAGGIEQALDWFASPVDTLVAIGLVLFGLFSLVEARFRRVPEPPVDLLPDALRR